MKKITVFLFLIISATMLWGQTPNDKYKSLLKKADTYYRTKNYKMASATYTQAFKLNFYKAASEERYNAACAFSLAEIPDSAFYHLNIIVKNGYTKYDQITNDPDLRFIRKDKRWKPLIEKVKINLKSKEAKLNKLLSKELDSIGVEDQKYRVRLNDIEQNYGSQSKEWEELIDKIKSIDSLNLIRLKQIIDQYGWPGPELVGDNGNAAVFLVVQHADIKTQEKYLPVMREAVKNGNAFASDLALLEDRVAVGQGKKQIYGSQIIKDPKTGKDTLATIEDFQNVDKRRAEVGLGSLEQYAKQWGIVYKAAIANKNSNFFSNADYTMAMEVHDSIVGPVKVNKGFGSKMEYRIDNDVKEENSAWFKFTIDHDTILTLDIVPNDPKDDFDFVLFKSASNYTSPNNIIPSLIKPERVCFSQNYDKNGSTGLSEYYTTTYVGPGPGSGYVAGLPIKAGETCYLMVTYSNVYPKNPDDFTIYFYNYWPNKPVKLRSKKPTVLNNVMFETNTTILLKESFVELDKLVSQMLKDKTIKVEVLGHTDNTGEESKNLKLSEERAKKIVEYMKAKKIDANRISYKGFGSSRPISSNNTEEGKKKNRRVEFLIK
jgi:outer membrane protein OmpA-like peptidoglycan-associated protein